MNNHEFRLMPHQGSQYAAQLDDLYTFLLGIAAFFVTLICVLILFFGIRWRRGSRANRLMRVQPSRYWIIESIWTGVPFLIVMTCFAWGATLFYRLFQMPAEALDVYVVGKQWMWKLQHEEGRREINSLHVPLGTPIRLTMISEDVIHSFYLPVFRTKMDVLPGRYSQQWFEPTREGEYHLFCAEYCGTSHSDMIGRVVVMKPEEYAEWVATETVEPPERTGERLFRMHGCADCHRVEPQPPGVETDVPQRAPSLVGLFGRRERLADGSTVRVDENYVRQSIRTPRAAVVAGFTPLMPAYTETQLTESEIFEIIAYLRHLADNDRQAGENNQAGESNQAGERGASAPP